jgi:hypothetical protein
MLELVHTSATRGLFDGKAGYTVVAATDGLPTALVRPLSEGSTAGVTRLGQGVDPELFAVYRIWRVTDGLTAITRIVPIEADYTGRPARLAHHVVLEGEEADGSTIAALLANPATFMSTWNGPPQTLPAKSVPLPEGPGSRHGQASPLETMTDHAVRWERHLASAATTARSRPLTILLPSRSPLRSIVGSIARHCDDAGRIRLETSLDHLVSASPSLLLLRDRSARTVGLEVGADWSVARGTSPPPDETTAPARRASSAEDPPPAGTLVMPTLQPPTAVATSWTGGAATPRGEAPSEAPGLHASAPPGTGPTVAESLLAYSTGALAGSALALAMRALVP